MLWEKTFQLDPLICHVIILKNLKVVNNIGQKGAQSLADALTENCETAEKKTDWKDMVSSIEYGITNLNLSGNNIRAEGAKYLSESVSKINTLTTFNISSNKLEPEGIKFISDSLKSNESITTLYLSENNMGTIGLKYISDALKEGSENKDDDDETCNIKQLIAKGNKLGILAKPENKQSGNVGMKSLRDMLKVNHKILLLDFEGNSHFIPIKFQRQCNL
jgi:Ran GTPase-activating protein (RanGAP) involved in mRNA processing and transport